MANLKDHMPMINEYLRGNAILTFISEDIGELYRIIAYLGESEEGFIDVSLPRVIPPEAEIVLTTSSIVILHRYGLLDSLNNYFKPIVLRESIEDIGDEINRTRRKLIEEKKILNRSLKINKERQIEKIRNLSGKLEVLYYIYNLLLSYKIIDIYPKLEENIISLVVPERDMNAAYLAKERDIYLLVDDAGSISLFESFIENKKITTTSAVLNTMMCSYGKLDRYLDVFYKMLEDQYLYTLDFRYLCSIIGICIQENKREDLRNIITALIKNDRDGQYISILKAYLDLSPNCRMVEREIIEEIMNKHIES